MPNPPPPETPESPEHPAQPFSRRATLDANRLVTLGRSLRRCRRAFRRMLHDQRGTTSLEWALLLGAIALPSVYLFTMSLGVVVDYYRMMTQITSLPLP